MSNVSSILEWVNYFLFGDGKPESQIPYELHDVVTRLDVDGIDWSEGRLAEFPFEVQRDLHVLSDHLERDDRPPTFKTKAIRFFFLQLEAALARFYQRKKDVIAEIGQTDKDILRRILQGQEISEDETLPYQCPKFWGRIARSSLNRQRPIEALEPLDRKSLLSERAVWLYELTCQTLGRVFDPLTTVMIPRKEHLDSKVWISDRTLESFVLANPDHELSRAVCGLVSRNAMNLMDGKPPTCLNEESKPTIGAFLSNLSTVDESIANVSERPPPKTIDVFHRLLVLTERDHLWKTDTEFKEPERDESLEAFRSTERANLLERNNKILLDYIAEAQKQ